MIVYACCTFYKSLANRQVVYFQATCRMQHAIFMHRRSCCLIPSDKVATSRQSLYYSVTWQKKKAQQHNSYPSLLTVRMYGFRFHLGHNLTQVKSKAIHSDSQPEITVRKSNSLDFTWVTIWTKLSCWQAVYCEQVLLCWLLIADNSHWGDQITL